MVNTASCPSGGALVVHGARGRGLRGRSTCKEHTFEHKIHALIMFSVRASNPSIMV